MKPIVIIPARGGSKGLPGKNIKILNGKPLIQYTIDAARELFPDEMICVSTDSVEIMACVESLGLSVPFLRPAELSSDTATSIDVILHALGYYKSIGYDIDTVILLQPTSPLRQARHVQESIAMFEEGSVDMVVSVNESKANPYYSLFEEDKDGFLHKLKQGDFTRRQDCPQIWEYNGAIYIVSVESLLSKKSLAFEKVKKYEMPSDLSIDIDTLNDFTLVEIILSRNK